MKKSPSSWPLVVAAGLAVVAGAFSLGRPGACSLPPATSNESLTPTQPNGETVMSTPTETEGKVHHANESNFDQLVLNSEVPVLVDFYADWCVPCKKLAPVLDQVARETPGVRVMKVNVDRNRRLAAHYGIRSLPSLMVFDGGKVTAQFVGVPKKEQLHQMLAKKPVGRSVQVSRRTRRPGE